MTNENNFYDRLREISDKLNQLEMMQKTDIMQIRASISSLTQYLTESHETSNFSELKSVLETLSYKIESCTGFVSNDLYADINKLKEIAFSTESDVKALQNAQRETLSSSSFEEFQRQHVNLTVKNNESLLAYIKNIKTSFDNIATYLSGVQNKQEEALTSETFRDAKEKNEQNIQQLNNFVSQELYDIKSSIAKITEIIPGMCYGEEISGIKSTAENIKEKINSVENDICRLTESDITEIKNDLTSLKSEISVISDIQKGVFSQEDSAVVLRELGNIKDLINKTQDICNSVSVNDKSENLQNEFESLKNIVSDIQSAQNRSIEDTADFRNCLNDIKNLIDGVNGKIYENKDNLSSFISESFEQLKSAVNEINGKIYENKDNLSSFMSENFEQLKSSVNELNGKIYETKENISTTVAENIEQIKSILNEINGKFEAGKDNANISFDDNFQQIKILLNEISENQKSISVPGELPDLSGIKDEIQKLSVVSVDESLKTEIDNIKNMIIEISSKNSEETLKNDIDEIKSLISNMSEKLPDLPEFEMLSFLEDDLNAIKDEISKLSENGGISADNTEDKNESNFDLKKDFESLQSDIFEIKNILYGMQDVPLFDDLENENANDDGENVDNADTPAATSATTPLISHVTAEAGANISSDISALAERINELHKNIKTYISDELSNKQIPTLAEISEAVFAINEENGKNIKKSTDLLGELRNSLSVLESDFRNKDFASGLEKISDIYNGLNFINDWIEKVGYINQSIENVYARLGENIDFDDVADKVDLIYENISEFNLKAQKIDEINGFAADILDKLPVLNSVKEKSDNILENISLIKEKIEKTFNSDIDYEEVLNKVDIIYENIFLLNNKLAKIDDVNILALDIKNKVTESENTKPDYSRIIEPLTSIKEKIERVFAFEPDAEDVTNKIDIIFENLSILNERESKTDNIDKNVNNVKDSIISIENKVNEISEKFDDNTPDLSRINDLAEKTDDISKQIIELSNTITHGEILRRLNRLALNIDDLAKSDDTESLKDLISDLSQKTEDFSKKANTESLTNLISDLSQKSEEIFKKTDNSATTEDAENIYEKLDEISNKADLITGEFLDSGIADKTDLLVQKVGEINDTVNDELFISKIDVIYENISLLNDWVIKIDNIVKKNEDAEEKLKKISGDIVSQFESISKLTDGFSSLKDNIDTVANEIRILSGKTKNDTESYVYSLFDIESDFLKLNKTLEDSTKETKSAINELKDSFSVITEDVSSISKRTNKLILTADDANREFERCLNSFKDALKVLETQNKTLNPDEKFELLHVKLAGIYEIMQQSVASNKNVNSQLEYIGGKADKTEKLLLSAANEIALLKQKQNAAKAETYFKELQAEIKNGNNILGLLSDGISSFEDGIAAIVESSGNNAGSAVKILNDVKTMTKAVSGVSDSVKINLKQNQLSLTELEEIKNTVSGLQKDVSSSDSILKDIQKSTENIQNTYSDVSEKLNMLEDGFSSFRNDEVSEIKSLMTGVTVQLSTSLRPEMDALGDKIEKISEDDSNNINALKSEMETKLAAQESKINAIEKKVDVLTEKFDKIADKILEKTDDSGIKEVLNYIATQLQANNEKSDVIKDVAAKINGFNEGINKIVSYIEED